MNMSPKYFQNNGFSEEKKIFYENLPSKYSKFSSDFFKKSLNEHSNFSKKVLNWFFAQPEETRMILCSVENKKYTNTIHDAYMYMLKHPNGVKFRFSEEDNKDSDKFKFETITDDYSKYFLQNDYNKYNDYYSNRNPYWNNNKQLEELKSSDKEFLKNIIFYQSESPIEDKKNYNSYFTLDKNFLKNEEIFKDCCNALSYEHFLSRPIMIKKDVQNKTILSIEMPPWITNEIKVVNQKQNFNYEDEDNYNYTNNEISNCNYYSLSQYCLALIEQTLCVRYVIYNRNKNMKEILNSIYLSDLLNKKEAMLSFMNSLNYEKEKFYEKFEIDEINISLFYDESIENFVREKNILLNIDNLCNDNEKINYLDKYKEAKINLNVINNKNLFEQYYEILENDFKKINKEIINNITFFKIDILFNYKDFLNRLIFDKIYEEYSKKICDDLIMDDEKKAKKKKKKKKKGNNENKINVNEIKEIDEKKKKNIYNFIKNFILDKLNEKLKEYHEKSNININVNNNSNKKNNKKEKEFFLYQPIKKKEKKKGNNKKNKNNNSNKKENNINLNEDNKSDNNINLNMGNKKESKIENNSNNNIIINPESKKEYKEDINTINIDYPNEKEDNINISPFKNIKTNFIPSKNSNISINSMEIQSHINSFTVSSSANNSSTSSDSLNFQMNSNLYKNEIYDTNNLFVVHQNPMIISYQKFYKLTNDIINFVNDIESLLVIIREIKFEIKKHFDIIIKKVYPDAKIEIYGSSLYKLDIETSDLDLSISSLKENNLEDLVLYLNNCNQDKKYLNINFISTASIPIIKLDIDFTKLNNEKIKELNKKLINNDYYKLCIKNNFYNDTNIIKVDISLNSINYKQINFIEQGIKQYPQIIYLIKLLKKLLLYKHMNNSYKGGMSSYCLFLIIYSYIKMYSTFYPNNSIDNNYGSILIGFLFNYVMCIDFKCTIINPLLNNPFKILNYPLDTIPMIIEPTTKKNAGKNIYRIFDVVNTLNEIYRDIYIVIRKDYNEDDNYIYELFKHYIENG